MRRYTLGERGAPATLPRPAACSNADHSRPSPRPDRSVRRNASGFPALRIKRKLFPHRRMRLPAPAVVRSRTSPHAGGSRRGAPAAHRLQVQQHGPRPQVERVELPPAGAVIAADYRAGRGLPHARPRIRPTETGAIERLSAPAAGAELRPAALLQGALEGCSEASC